MNARESSAGSSDSGSQPGSRRLLSPNDRRTLKSKISLKNFRPSKLIDDNRIDSAQTSQMSVAFKQRKSKGLQALEKVYKEY
mmetsp:Transcript_19887/g.30638  ORF Transcript_19887/g.30638 Transcript_19887/m.30638 type:complete len:82 (+) Transcript_19887:2337-2582(+)